MAADSSPASSARVDAISSPEPIDSTPGSPVPSVDTEPSAIFKPESWTALLPLERIFPSQQPLEVDLGCGKGRFLLASARANPGTNYLGLDRMLKRLKKVSSKIVRDGLNNVKLLRVEAAYAVEFLLPEQSVSGMYVYFPDPWPKRKHHKKRLFNTAFMDSLSKVMKEGAPVHIATDSQEYFDDIHELFRSDRRFAPITPLELTEDRQTDFELEFKSVNLPTYRCSFARSES